MMRQWRAFKGSHPSHVLLFRMGDFYELFYDDARTASAVLSLTLTSRLGVPMSGFPHFSLATHLRRLLAAGHTAAICDQMESVSDSKERRSSVVHREVTRIVTQGTLVEEGWLNPKQSNFLLAVHAAEATRDGRGELEGVALCWVDVSTGVLEHRALQSPTELAQEVARIAPAEVLVPQSLAEHRQLKSALQSHAVTSRPDAAFSEALDAHIAHWQQQAEEKRRKAEKKRQREEQTEADNDVSSIDAPAAILTSSKASSSTPPSSSSSSPSSPSLSQGSNLVELHPSDLLLRCSPGELRACAAVLDYLVYTQRSSVPQLFTAASLSAQSSMSIDASTRRSLELTHSLSRASRVGSLLHSIDHTVTAAGGRLLSSYLASPLTDARLIDGRLDAVEFFARDRLLMENVRALLKECEDVQRGLQRIGMRKGGGGAREMRAIVKTLRKGEDIARAIRDAQLSRGGRATDDSAVPSALAPLLTLLTDPSLATLASLLDRAVVDDPPLLLENGHFIRHSYHPPLSTLSSHSSSTQQRIGALQQSLRTSLSLPGLKIQRNTGIGYFISLTATRAAQLEERRRSAEGGPLMDGLSLFQQLKGEWRYKSRELIGLQNDIANAGDAMLALELKLYEELRDGVMARAALLSSAAQAISAVDVYSALAHLAIDHAYVRPKLVQPDADGEQLFDVVAGRHPVVEERMHALHREREKQRKVLALEQSRGAEEPPPGASADLEPVDSETSAEDSTAPNFSTLYSSATPYVDFTPNDCSLRTSSARLWLLTGPNMAGKSTFLRQNALLALMASMGSFVPAASLTLTPVDQLFSRIGGSVTDDLSRDQSTFMSEMLELSSILRQATPRSLVIVDEVGRGTSTFDGLSIALAALEFLHDSARSRCLFATHYHELAEARDALPHLALYKMEVEEEDDEDRQRGGAADVSFLHRVVPGVVSSSYGLHVARMARLPPSVSMRAEQLLNQLEGGRHSYKELVKRVISNRQRPQRPQRRLQQQQQQHTDPLTRKSEGEQTVQLRQ